MVSVAGDTSGVTVYYPREEAAFFAPGGLPVAGACVPVRSVLFLIRTGMPCEMEQWMIPPGAVIGGHGAVWVFTAEGRVPGSELTVTLKPGNLFPSSLAWPGGALSLNGATPGNEFEAWPSSWDYAGDSMSVHAEISSIRSPAEPWPGLWDLSVPVPVDTLSPLPRLVPAWPVDME